MTAKQNISAIQAKELLKENKPLKDLYISGILDIVDFEKNDRLIHIENCVIENLKSECVEFSSSVELINSEFKKCTFSFSYFIGGLKIQNCVFLDYLDFQCGGHNKISNSVLIDKSTFHEFVNFYDCSYNGPVEISDNDFKSGTNLTGNKNEPFQVTFDIEPIMTNNKGQIDLNGEKI